MTTSYLYRCTVEIRSLLLVLITYSAITVEILSLLLVLITYSAIISSSTLANDAHLATRKTTTYINYHSIIYDIL